MRLARLALALGLLTCGTVTAGDTPLQPLDQWPAWRGPLGTGVAPNADPPVTWSESSGVRWKVALPGKGHATPVIWGQRLFVTSAVPAEAVKVTAPLADHHPDGAHDNVLPTRRYRFVVLAIDTETGATLWERTVRTAIPHEGVHTTGSWASNSAVTDGERVYASFGSQGLYALTLDGELVWSTDLGDMATRHGHGEGSSPALHGQTLVVNWDHEGDSFVVALDSRTGETRWRRDRPENTSWSSPLIVEHAGKAQAIVSATRRVRSYDLATGELLWECGGLSRNVVASPVAADGYVYFGNSYDDRAMLAVRLDLARGDITGSEAVVWSIDRHTPYVPSPLLVGGTLYFLKHNQGFLSALEATTGRPRYAIRRLPGIGNVFASPAAAANRIYIVDRDGTCVVVRQGPEFAVLATNTLDDSFSASPVIVGDALFLRGERFLYRIDREDEAPPPAVPAVRRTDANADG